MLRWHTEPALIVKPCKVGSWSPLAIVVGGFRGQDFTLQGFLFGRFQYVYQDNERGLEVFDRQSF